MPKVILEFDPPVFHQYPNADWEVRAYVYHPVTGEKHPHRDGRGLNKRGMTKKERVRRGRNSCVSVII